MKQLAFEQHYSACWTQMDQALAAAEQRTFIRRKKTPLDPQLPQLYRRICHHLSLAQERRYSSYLIARLNHLVLRGHQQLYQRQSHFLTQLIQFVVYTFPHQVRQQLPYIWVSSLLLYGPALIIFGLIQLQPELVYSMFEPSNVSNFEAMYDPSSDHFGQDRDAQSDLYMFGYYIRNNITVGFQTFATGIVVGIGSIFYLVFNGLNLGAVASHLVNIDYHRTFFPFVIGHGAFELTAIVFAGAGGLMLGHSLIAPGQYTRLNSLKQMARKALDLLYGVIIMLIIAAFLEAFWSSNSALGLPLKYTVGALLWLSVLGYFSFAGKAPKVKSEWN